MSRRQKIAIIAVFVVMVLLYSGAVANGGRSGQGNASGHPGGLVGWLGHLVGQPPAAALSDLSAPCLVGRTLTVKGTCTLTVAHSDKGTRRVKMHAGDPLSVTSRAPQSKSDVKADVKANADVSVTVDGDGGNIVLACADSSATCTVTLP